MFQCTQHALKSAQLQLLLRQLKKGVRMKNQAAASQLLSHTDSGMPQIPTNLVDPDEFTTAGSSSTAARRRRSVGHREAHPAAMYGWAEDTEKLLKQAMEFAQQSPQNLPERCVSVVCLQQVIALACEASWLAGWLAGWLCCGGGVLACMRVCDSSTARKSNRPTGRCAVAACPC